MIKLQRLANLRHASGVQYHDLVRQGHRLDLIVGDVDHRALEALVQAGDLNSHLHAQRRIKVGERLIEQEHARLRHQRTANGYALALTTGKRFRLAIQQMAQLEYLGNLGDTLVNDVFLCAGQLEAERHIFCHREMGIERIGLEHHADAAIRRGDLIHSRVANH